MPVIQEEPSGCGIASVAALAGVSYQEAKDAANDLGIYAHDSRLWSETQYITILLRHFGLSAADVELPFVSWRLLPSLALLSVKWHIEKGRPYWHWVVFWRSPDGPLVFDSKKTLKTNIRTDFGRIKPKWYIPIEKGSHNCKLP
ncbi:MAG: hypothetical protein L7F77_14550 [Candidatus Magnetominusculus sp. LBB02]|nr:hypothetical protein [Candidatus Magnetominusculus sp. LBB02]